MAFFWHKLSKTPLKGSHVNTVDNEKKGKKSVFWNATNQQLQKAQRLIDQGK